MATGQLNTVLRHIHKLASAGADEAGTDSELLQRFCRRHEEAAFAALVQRHGPMVLGVCRRVLHNSHDAEDAFQATFLILVRKASSISKAPSLSCWLHQVAQRIALRLRSREASRRSHERQVPEMPHPDWIAGVVWRDLRLVLDEEVQRLPEKYRVPFVLCYLEGLTYEKAARQLHCLTGMISKRLARARELLRGRLARRGLALPASLLAITLSENATPAALTAPLATATIKAALTSATGTTAGVTAQVATLVEGGIRTMTVTKIKLFLALVLAVGLLGAGVGWLTHSAWAGKSGTEAQPAEKGKTPPTPAEKGKTPKAKEADNKVSVTVKVVDAEDKPIANADVAVLGRVAGEKPGTSKYGVLEKGKTDKDGKFHLVKNGGGRVISSMHILAHAKGYGLGWAEPHGRSLLPGAYLAIGNDIVLPSPSYGVPVKKDGPPIIRLSREQVLKGRLLDLQGLAAANVKCRVARVHALKPEDRPREMSNPYDYLKLLSLRGVFDFAEEFSSKDWPFWPKAITTDKEGRFTLPGFALGHEVVLLIQDERFALQEVVLRAGGKGEVKEISASLAPARIIEGKVVCEDTKKPVADAWLTIDSLGPGGPVLLNRRGNTLRARTDEQGRFRINPYLADRFFLRIGPGKGEPYLALTRTVDWPKGAVKKTVEIALPRGILLDGKVTVKGSDKGVAGATVFFEPRVENNPKRRSDMLVGREWVAYTKDDGAFTLVVPPGPGHLLCVARGKEFVRKTISSEELSKGKAGGDRKQFQAIVPLDLKVDDSPKKMSIEVQRGVTLRGKVVGPDGKLVKQAVMFCGSDLGEPSREFPVQGFRPPGVGGTLVRALTIKDGTFELPGCDPEKTYRVLVVDNPGGLPGKGGPPMPHTALLKDTPGRVGVVANLSAKQAAGKPITIELQPCGKAEVRFADAKGKAARASPWLDLIVTPKQGNLQPEWIVLAAGRSNPALLNMLTPDKEGRLTISGLIPGATYRLVGLAERDLTQVTFEREFTAESGKTLKLGDIQVEK
jgi:RNA polymerase sigma factor (sigma-70 family)